MRIRFLVFILAMMIFSGCAPSTLSTFTVPAPSTVTPVPVSTTAPPPSATPSAIPANTSTVASDPTHRPSEPLSPGSSLVFSTDFNNGVPAEFTGVTTLESVQGYAGLGNAPNIFDGDFLHNSSIPPLPTTLTLTGLPAHTSIDLHFLLAIINSWDGYEGACCGSDSFTITIDGKPVLNEVFDNAAAGGKQSYFPAPGVELARMVDLGFHFADINHLDSGYDMSKEPKFTGIRHTSDTLTIEWYASGTRWQGGTDESWAIDNVQVILNSEDN